MCAKAFGLWTLPTCPSLVNDPNMQEFVFHFVTELPKTREEQLEEMIRISKELGSFEPFGSFWYPFGSELSAYG